MRITRCTLALLAVLSMLTPNAGARADATVAAGAELGSMISGRSEYVDGTFIWTDYAYDDRGSAAASTNTADLIQLHIDLDPDELIVRAILQTMYEEARTWPQLLVGFDVDWDTETGGDPERFGWNFTAPLGIDVAYSSSEGKLLAATAAGGWEQIATPALHGDPDANVMEVRIPRAVLDPGTAIWRAVAGLGADPVVDLAFVGDEEPVGWENAKQSQIIANQAPPFGASSAIFFDKILAGVTERSSARTPGFHTLLYRSDLDLGEGIRDFTIQTPGGRSVRLDAMYAGRYQPYVVRIPDNLPDDPPLVTFLHGLGGTHTSSSSMFGTGKLDPAAVVAFPLGRAGMSFYLGPGEQDVLDVTDDAIARFGADPERVTLAGVSMGGFGAFRLGILRPDRWSAIVPLIGTARSAQALVYPAAPPQALNDQFSPAGFMSGAGELMENLLNVPVRMVNGQLDPIVNYSFAAQDAAWLLQRGYDHKAWVLHRRHHEVVPAISNCVLAEAVAMRKDSDPRRVLFRVEPDTFVSDPASGLDLRYDRAYWVSGIVPRDGATVADVAAESYADPNVREFSAPLAEADATGTTDLCGNAMPGAGDPYRMTGLGASLTDAVVENRLSVGLFGVEQATLDLARTGLDTSDTIVLNAGWDGPTRLTLRAPWPGDVNVVAGASVLQTLTPVDGAIALDLHLLDESPLLLVPSSA